MSREYTVSTWYAWEDEDGAPVRDQHGNYRGTVFFEEDPKGADATFKTQPEKGDKKYGIVEAYTTKAGKERTRFKRADRQQEGQQSFGNTPKSSWQPRDDNSIKAQWAIGRAYETIKPRDDQAWKLVKQDAQLLLVMVEQIKDPSKELKPQTPKQVERDEDRELAAALKATIDDGEPVNLNDIPF